MNRKYVIGGVLVGFILVYVSAGLVVDKNLADARKYLDEQIIIQTATVSETATVLGKGSASDRIAAVIKECPTNEVIRYDDLLASLDKGLEDAELSELSSLFNKCGQVAASRRAGMALVLEEQTASLEKSMSARAELGDYDLELESIQKWEELVTTEKRISSLFNDLVMAQGEIIALLQSNVGPSEISVENVRASAQIMREELAGLTGRASTLRTELLSS
jgi:hypothetical protein